MKEYELFAKLEDMEEKRALEEQKLQLEREKAASEAIDRACAIKADEKKAKWQTRLAALGLGGSIIFAAVGYLIDRPDSEMIRKSGQERDRDRLFNFGDKLKKL